MSNDQDIKLKILKILRIFYNQNVDRDVNVPEIFDQLGNEVSYYEIIDQLKELAQDSLIILELDEKNHYHARLTYKGLEELKKLESGIIHQSNSVLKDQKKQNDTESFKKDIYRLKRYYKALRDLLEVHFGGDTVNANEEANRYYLQLCVEILKILSKPEFANLSKYSWRPFDNLLSIDPDYPEGNWELGGRQSCSDFQSKVEESFIENGQQEHELNFIDANLINSVSLFSKKYKEEKNQSEILSRQVGNLLKDLKPQTIESTVTKPVQPRKQKIPRKISYAHAKASFDQILVKVDEFFEDGMPTEDNTVNELLDEIYDLIKASFPDGQSKIFNFKRQLENVDWEAMQDFQKNAKNVEHGDTYRYVNSKKLDFIGNEIGKLIKELIELNKEESRKGLSEVKISPSKSLGSEIKITTKPHDFFICHATEDKDIVARPLAQALDKLGLDVWYDEFSLRWGSKLMKTITKGIRESKFGIVVLSPDFFEKKWAQLELDALVALLNLDDGELLPLVYNLTHEQVKERLPLLSGILYRSWDEGLDQLVQELNDMIYGKEDGFRKTNIMKSRPVSTIKSKEYDITLDKFTENGNHYVGIRNHRGRAIKSCCIKSDSSTCSWWDNNEIFPRNVAEGEAGNVLLPRGFANTNPIITVMSGKDIIEQVRLSNIPRRPNSKWNAEDENDVKVDWTNTAISRIRSNLGTLSSLFRIFLDFPKGVPVSPEIKNYLSQKDELVEGAQIIVNQSAQMLDRSWVDSLNDLCSLAKKNPWFLEGGTVQVMQCESCVGIINQIDNILFRLPNPPI